MCPPLLQPQPGQARHARVTSQEAGTCVPARPAAAAPGAGFRGQLLLCHLWPSGSPGSVPSPCPRAALRLAQRLRGSLNRWPDSGELAQGMRGSGGLGRRGPGRAGSASMPTHRPPRREASPQHMAGLARSPQPGVTQCKSVVGGGRRAEGGGRTGVRGRRGKGGGRRGRAAVNKGCVAMETVKIARPPLSAARIPPHPIIITF